MSRPERLRLGRVAAGVGMLLAMAGVCFMVSHSGKTDVLFDQTKAWAWYKQSSKPASSSSSFNDHDNRDIAEQPGQIRSSIKALWSGWHQHTTHPSHKTKEGGHNALKRAESSLAAAKAAAHLAATKRKALEAAEAQVASAANKHELKSRAEEAARKASEAAAAAGSEAEAARELSDDANSMAVVARHLKSQFEKNAEQFQNKAKIAGVWGGPSDDYVAPSSSSSSTSAASSSASTASSSAASAASASASSSGASSAASK